MKEILVLGPGCPRCAKLHSDVEEAARENEPLEKTGDRKWDVPVGILCMVLGCFSVYSALFATGNWIYGKYGLASVLTGVFIVSVVLLARSWGRLRTD